MKRKALCFVLTLLVMAVFSLVGCGGGGGHSNPASSNIAGNARVSGVVVDSSNNPVPNAKVRLVLASKALVNSLINNISSTSRLATNDNQNEFTTNTDNKGQYTFVNVPYGEYTLSAVTANGAQIVTRLSVNAAEIDSDKIVLAPFGSISGVVTDAKEQPIKGAVVYIDGTSYCSITDDFGGYTLKYVPINTALKLCAMASGFETKTNTVTIDPEQKLDLDSETEEVNFSLTALTTTTKFCLVNCSISGEGANLNNLLVLAVSDDAKNVYVAQASNGAATICITTPGKYNIIPASLYNGTNVAGTSKTLEISGKEIQSNGSKDLTLSIGKPTYGGSPAYATLSGSIDNTNISDTQFEVHLIDETGHDRKQIISSDLNFTFNNVPDGNYKIIVCSDNSLFVSSNYGISDGKGLEIPSPLTPVVVTPEVSLSNGSATVKIVNSPFEYNNNLASFSVYGFDKSSNPILLYRNEGGKVDLSVYEFSAKAGTEANVSLDNLSADSTLGGIKFLYRNETDYRSDKPIFEKMYTFNKGKPDYRKISLGSLKVSNNIILFKTVTYRDALYYLVVTLDETQSETYVYVFDSTGNQVTCNEITGKVTYGNACLLTDTNITDPTLYVQFEVEIEGSGRLFIWKYLFSELVTSDGANAYPLTPEDGNNSPKYSPNSINKILATSDGKIFSVCDNYVLIYDPSVVADSSWTQIGFGTSNRTVAPFSTIVPSSDNNHKIFYINHEDNGACAGYKAYLGVSEFDADNTSTTVKYNYEIGEFHLYYGNTSNCNTGSTRIGSNDYSYYILFDNTGYPFSLSDCLDNLEATNKVFIHNGYNWNNGTKLPTINSELVFSNTIYSATNIESSFINAGYNFETWIERKPNEQYFVLRNKNSFKEHKILINQVFNSSAYLESSIGYSKVNGEQVHVICADSDNNIQVMVLNCIDPDHKN